MSGDFVMCICDKAWCECEAYVLIDDYDPRDRRAIACEDCAAGNHVAPVFPD